MTTDLTLHDAPDNASLCVRFLLGGLGTVFPATDDPARGALFWLSNTLHPMLRMLFDPDQHGPGAADALRHHTRPRLIHQFPQKNQSGDVTPHPVLACYLAPLLRWPSVYGGDTSWFDLFNSPSQKFSTKAFGNSPAAHQTCLAEGLGQTLLSKSHLPNPPEGSAT